MHKIRNEIKNMIKKNISKEYIHANNQSKNTEVDLKYKTEIITENRLKISNIQVEINNKQTKQDNTIG